MLDLNIKMSLVSIVAKNNFLCIASDGRVLGQEQEIIDERYKKFRLPNPNCFVAYAGNKEPCEWFLKASALYHLDVMDYSKLATRVQSMLLNPPFSTYKILLAFGGVNPENEIEFYSLSTLEPNIQHLNPKGSDVAYAFLNNSLIKKFELETIFKESLQIHGFNLPDQISRAQIEFNNIIADRDFSVNKNVFYSTINLEHMGSCLEQ